MKRKNQRYHKLTELVESSTNSSNDSFSGLGIIVSNDMVSLPLFQLPVAKSLEEYASESTAEILRRLSCETNALHDGFHILDTSLKLLKSNCYVAPPIPPPHNISINSKWNIERLGSRWFTAYFSSMLPQVYASVAVGATGNVHYFIGGDVYIDSLEND